MLWIMKLSYIRAQPARRLSVVALSEEIDCQFGKILYANEGIENYCGSELL